MNQPNPQPTASTRTNNTFLWTLLGCGGALFALAALTVAGLLAFMFLGDREEQASDPSPDTSSSQAVSPKSGEPETVGDTHLAYSEARGEDPDHDYVVRARYEDESGGGFEIGIENDPGRTLEEDTAGFLNPQKIGPWVCGTQYEMNVCMADDERGRVLLVPLDTDADLSTIAAWGEEFMEQLK